MPSGTPPTDPRVIWLVKTLTRPQRWRNAFSWALKTHILISVTAILLFIFGLIGYFYHTYQMRRLSQSFLRLQVYAPPILTTLGGKEETNLGLNRFHIQTRSPSGIPLESIITLTLSIPGKHDFLQYREKTDLNGVLSVTIPENLPLPPVTQVEITAVHKQIRQTFTCQIGSLFKESPLSVPKVPTTELHSSLSPDVLDSWLNKLREKNMQFHAREIISGSDIVMEGANLISSVKKPLKIRIRTLEHSAPLVLTCWWRGMSLSSIPCLPESTVTDMQIRLPEQVTGIVRVVLYNYSVKPPAAIQEILFLRVPHEYLGLNVRLKQQDRISENSMCWAENMPSGLQRIWIPSGDRLPFQINVYPHLTGTSAGALSSAFNLEKSHPNIIISGKIHSVHSELPLKDAEPQVEFFPEEVLTPQPNSPQTDILNYASELFHAIHWGSYASYEDSHTWMRFLDSPYGSFSQKKNSDYSDIKFPELSVLNGNFPALERYMLSALREKNNADVLKQLVEQALRVQTVILCELNAHQSSLMAPITYDNLQILENEYNQQFSSFSDSHRCTLFGISSVILYLTLCMILFIFMMSLLKIPTGVSAWFSSLGVTIFAFFLAFSISARSDWETDLHNTFYESYIPPARTFQDTSDNRVGTLNTVETDSSGNTAEKNGFLSENTQIVSEVTRVIPMGTNETVPLTMTLEITAPQKPGIYILGIDARLSSADIYGYSLPVEVHVLPR